MQQSKRFLVQSVLKNENYPYLVSEQLLNRVITNFNSLKCYYNKIISRLTFQIIVIKLTIQAFLFDRVHIKESIAKISIKQLLERFLYIKLVLVIKSK